MQLSEQLPSGSADDSPKHQLLSRCADVAMKRSRQQQITDSAKPGAPLVLNIFSTCVGALPESSVTGPQQQWLSVYAGAAVCCLRIPGR